MIGLLSGAASPVNPMLILQRGVIVRATAVGSREMFEAMNRAIEVGGMRPVIDRTFAFAEAKHALHHLQSQKHLGKIVIDIAN
jgi:NADPH:quinone reductase-like Zn-dependent oxidoreductase